MLEREILSQDFAREQAEVQAEKHRTRLLGEYDRLILAPDVRDNSDVQDFLRPYCAHRDEVSLQAVIEGISQFKQEKSSDAVVHWADMGGGYGVALRQAHLSMDNSSFLQTTNIDIIRHDIEGLNNYARERLLQEYPDLLEDSVAPSFMRRDAEKVSLSQPADVITAVEMIQYQNNPIEVLTNAYNQLVDHGLLMVATEHAWSERIVYEDDNEAGGPVTDLMEIFDSYGIDYALTDTSDLSWRRQAEGVKAGSSLVVRKLPQTRLTPSLEIAKVDRNRDGYKSVSYRTPSRSSIVAVENC